MKSAALSTFEHAIQDALDLLGHFDSIDKQSPRAEVLKRASLVMALAALETYVEDRIIEAVHGVACSHPEPGHLANFYKASLESDLKTFHTPNADRVKAIFQKYLSIDVTAGFGIIATRLAQSPNSTDSHASVVTLPTDPHARFLDNRCLMQ